MFACCWLQRVMSASAEFHIQWGCFSLHLAPFQWTRFFLRFSGLRFIYISHSPEEREQCCFEPICGQVLPSNIHPLCISNIFTLRLFASCGDSFCKMVAERVDRGIEEYTYSIDGAYFWANHLPEWSNSFTHMNACVQSTPGAFQNHPSPLFGLVDKVCLLRWTLNINRVHRVELGCPPQCCTTVYSAALPKTLFQCI